MLFSCVSSCICSLWWVVMCLMWVCSVVLVLNSSSGVGVCVIVGRFLGIFSSGILN